MPTVTLFQTERIICRRLLPSDIDEMYAVYSDADAMRWVDDGQPIQRSECNKWLTVTLGNYESRGYGMSTLVSRGDGAVIGFCGLVHPNNQPEAEIKYALHRRFWGAGLATEAVKGMLEYGRCELQISAVIATVASENIASRRVLLKAGMQEAKRYDESGSLIMVFRWQSD
ncbi:MAG: GNAT family N-acetyltransferase [Leptolyngbyaceae cyanobacterium]|mgnify:CR=1 FL=1